MKKLFFIIINLFLIATTQSQLSKQHRYFKQTYLEDSVHVYWNEFPNPFSPPTVTNTNKGFIRGDITFYCDISDSVEVALITKKDSIVHKTTLKSSKPPYFSAGYWVAGANISQQSLPTSYFQPSSDGYLRWVIIVGGRWKSIRERGIEVRKGWHYWIDTGRTSK
ncbi:MAG: hypothetical protein KGZ58_05960 [Ignavibacteriales bacterium]|nr:hypothetical protein [Ignavibacteriales bacterium]